MLAPRTNKRRNRSRGGKGNPARKTAKRAMRRAKKAALEAAKNISVREPIAAATDLGQEAHMVQESASFRATIHEDPSRSE